MMRPKLALLLAIFLTLLAVALAGWLALSLA